MYRLIEPVPLAYARISRKCVTILVTLLLAMPSPTHVSQPVLPRRRGVTGMPTVRPNSHYVKPLVHTEHCAPRDSGRMRRGGCGEAGVCRSPIGLLPACLNAVLEGRGCRRAAQEALQGWAMRHTDVQSPGPWAACGPCRGSQAALVLGVERRALAGRVHERLLLPERVAQVVPAGPEVDRAARAPRRLPSTL